MPFIPDSPSKPTPGGEYVRSLSRGLDLVRSFSSSRRSLSITEAASAISVDRATARRLLLTLVADGYAQMEGGRFSLRPKVLEFGFAFLRSADFPTLAQQVLERFSEKLEVTASAGVLSEGEVLYVCRAVRQSPVTVNIDVGMKVPLYRSSIGRVLLAASSSEYVAAYLSHVRAVRHTHKTIIGHAELEEVISQTRVDGYSLVDEELEMGLRTIAVPVVDHRGTTVAAINAATVGASYSPDKMVARFLSPLKGVSREIGLAIK